LSIYNISPVFLFISDSARPSVNSTPKLMIELLTDVVSPVKFATDPENPLVSPIIFCP